MLEKKPFVLYDDSQKEDPIKDVVSVRLTPDERKRLDAMKRQMQQDKDSTALKFLAFDCGYNVIHGQSPYVILAEMFKNIQRNKRTGIPVDEPTLERM